LLAITVASGNPLTPAKAVRNCPAAALLLLLAIDRTRFSNQNSYLREKSGAIFKKKLIITAL
jgi:hypothetical protein